MANIQAPTALLDGAVLALLSQEDQYGYLITKTMQNKLSVSESTMYPILRRLTKDGDLETYDQPYEGRMRRYYRITSDGKKHLKAIKKDWQAFDQSIDELLGGKA